MAGVVDIFINVQNLVRRLPRLLLVCLCYRPNPVVVVSSAQFELLIFGFDRSPMRVALEIKRSGCYRFDLTSGNQACIYGSKFGCVQDQLMAQNVPLPVHQD